jgi:hypothetical protein
MDKFCETYPDFLVDKTLTQALPYTGTLGSSICHIIEDTPVGQFSLFWSQPASLERAVRKSEDSDDSNADRDSALDDLQTLVEARQDRTCDETYE